MSQFAPLKSQNVRDHWDHEAHEFTPWVANEIRSDRASELEDTLGLDLTVVEIVDTVIDTPNEREGLSYDRYEQSIELADRRTVTANVWIDNPDRDTYIGHQSVEKRARLAARASGRKGSAEGYILRTWQKLNCLGIDDQHISEFVRTVRNMSDSNQTGSS